MLLKPSVSNLIVSLRLHEETESHRPFPIGPPGDFCILFDLSNRGRKSTVRDSATTVMTLSAHLKVGRPPAPYQLTWQQLFMKDVDD